MRKFESYKVSGVDAVKSFLSGRKYPDSGIQIFSQSSIDDLAVQIDRFGLSFVVTDSRICYREEDWKKLCLALYGIEDGLEVFEQLLGLANSGIGSISESRIFISTKTVLSWLNGKR